MAAFEAARTRPLGPLASTSFFGSGKVKLRRSVFSISARGREIDFTDVHIAAVSERTALFSSENAARGEKLDPSC